MLLPGEQELADQLLKLTKTARDEDATFSEQARILRNMGELYLKDATETRNGEQFVKASALINAALVRTEDERKQYPLQDILCNIYKNFIKYTVDDTCEVTVDTLVNRTNSNQDFLHKLRVEIDEMCENLKVHFYSETCDLHKMEEEITQEAEKVSAHVQTMMLKFVTRLWTEATELLSVSPPCDYAVLGLGSLARQETTPFSDLEFALLVETNTEENNQYFKNLVYLFHLLVLDLGESPIPGVAIESLNDFMLPDGDKYFDGITPRGFRLDGAMPWACKTPIGRKQTPLKEPLDLIKSPEEMAALQQEDNVLGQSYHVSDILCNSILICGDLRLFEKYKTLKRSIILETTYKEMAKKSLIEDYERSPEWSLLPYRGSDNLHSKTVFYRFPSTFVENLRIYFTPDHQVNSIWKVLNHFSETRILSELGAFNLKALMAMSYGLRLLTYLQNRGQHESFVFHVAKNKVFDKMRNETVKQRSRSRLAQFGNGTIIDRLAQGGARLRHIVQSYFMEKDKGSVHDLFTENFAPEEDPLNEKTFSWERNEVIFGNLRWAISSKELPFNGCGQACGVGRLRQFSYIPMDGYPAMLKALDEILDIKGCTCLSLLRTSLLVSKYFLIVEGNVATLFPEADIWTLLTRYKQKQYRNVRERFYLLLDICDLALWLEDTNGIWIITDEIEAFFDDIRTIEKTQQKIVDFMKQHLISVSISLYRCSGQNHKGVQLCQKEIDKMEREHGIDGSKLNGGFNYEAMGDFKERDRPREAVNYYNQALNMNPTIKDKLPYFFSENNQMLFPETERRLVDNMILRQNTILAMKIEALYRRLNKTEDAIDVLKRVLTENGQIVDIEHDVDIKAMCRLCLHLSIFAPSNTNIREGNKYLEKILEIIIERDPKPRLKPTTTIEVATVLHSWITRLNGLLNTPFIIENIYKEYCRGNCGEVKTKEQFLVEKLCKVINNESTHTHFLEIECLKKNTFQFKKLGSTVRGYDFIFALCCLVVDLNVFSWHIPIVSALDYRMIVLEQLYVFCEKVVKKVFSKNVYKMCLVYLSFQKAKLRLFYAFYSTEVGETEIKTTVASTEKLHHELLRYFPNCRTAQMATERTTLHAMFKNRVK